MGATAYSLFVLPAFSFSSRALGSGAADYCHNTLPNPCVSFHRPLSPLRLLFDLTALGHFPPAIIYCFCSYFYHSHHFTLTFNFLFSLTCSLMLLRLRFFLFTRRFELFLFESLSSTRICSKEASLRTESCFCFFEL